MSDIRRWINLVDGDNLLLMEDGEDKSVTDFIDDLRRCVRPTASQQ